MGRNKFRNRDRGQQKGREAAVTTRLFLLTRSSQLVARSDPLVFSPSRQLHDPHTKIWLTTFSWWNSTWRYIEFFLIVWWELPFLNLPTMMFVSMTLTVWIQEFVTNFIHSYASPHVYTHTDEYIMRQRQFHHLVLFYFLQKPHFYFYFTNLPFFFLIFFLYRRM